MRRRISRGALALASILCAAAMPAIASGSRSRGGTGTTTGDTSITGDTGTSTTGGSGLGATATGTTTSPSGTSTPTGSAPASGVVALTFGKAVWSSADGITISATGSAVHGQLLRFAGAAPASDAGSTVLIRYAAASAPGGWIQATQAQVGSTGTFSATWTASVRGRLAFTITLVRPNAVPAASPPSTSFVVQVFSSGTTTIYGPGLWGHRAACGERLHRFTLGVASRTVKCGTDVAVYYRGREIVVPVIDRGPYGSRAKWDLTEATARALGVRQTATVRTIEPWPHSQPLLARS